MFDETLQELEKVDAFFNSLDWPDYKLDPQGAAKCVDELLNYLEMNLHDYMKDMKQVLKRSDKHEGAYQYCKDDFKEAVEDFHELLECLADFNQHQNSRKAQNYYKLVVGQVNTAVTSHAELWDAVYEKSQIDRVNKAIMVAVKSYRKNMDTMRSRGRLLMQRQIRDKSKRYPRQLGSDTHGFFQLPSKTDPTMQHHELLTEINAQSHPMDKIAAIEKYLLDPNAKGTLYQQSFKIKLVQAVNNGLFMRDMDGLIKITSKMSPDKMREVFSENAEQWHHFHFPNHQLPAALTVQSPSIK